MGMISPTRRTQLNMVDRDEAVDNRRLGGVGLSAWPAESSLVYWGG